MVSFRKPGIVVAIAAAAAIVLAGCSGGGTASPSGSADSSTKLPNTGWKTGDAQQGGTLTLAVDNTPSNWQLYNTDAGTVDDQLLAGLFTPSLIQLKPDGTWEPDPNFATEIKLVSEDPQVVEAKINPDAVWSDGSPMTVADYEATWKALNGTNPDFAPTATNVFEDIESVEQGSDERDIKITFSKKNADWPSILSFYPKWAVDTPDHFNNLWKNLPVAADGTTPVSGGPYVVKDYDQNGQVVTFVPNPRWWGDKPKLDQIVFRAVSRNGLPQAFANKELDAVDLHGSADGYTTAAGRSDAKIERSLGTAYRHITLNGTSSVFKDKKVRQAFAKSFDRNVLARAILSGVKSPVTLLNNLIYLPGQTGYTDDATAVIGQNVDDAKKLLEDAGWKIGSNGYAAKGGKTLTVRFVIPADNQNSANIAQLVQQQTKKAGFKVNIDVVPSADFFTRYVTAEDRDFDATYFSWVGTAFPISSTKSIFYPADSGQNFSGITDDSLGAAFDKANAELDPKTRIADAHAIDKKLVALVTTVPLFPEPNAWGVNDKLVNYGPTQFETVHWEKVGFTG